MQTPRVPRNLSENHHWSRVVVLLDGCALDVATVKPLQGHKDADRSAKLKTKKFGSKEALPTLLDSRHASHRSYIRRVLKDSEIRKYRPDVILQSLLQLLDSALCLSGHMEVYLRTIRGILIRVDPRLRCPLKIEEFCEMITGVLLEYKVRASAHGQQNGLSAASDFAKKSIPISVLRTIKGSLLQHVPLTLVDSHRLATESYSSVQISNPAPSIYIFSTSAEHPVSSLRKLARLHAPIDPWSLSTEKVKQDDNFNNPETAGATDENEITSENVAKKNRKEVETSSSLYENVPIAPVFIIGGFSHEGKIDDELWDKEAKAHGVGLKRVRIAPDTLSAARCCAQLTYEYEQALGL